MTALCTCGRQFPTVLGRSIHAIQACPQTPETWQAWQAERFWAHVQKGSGCWAWTGAVGRNGYGYFSDFGLAHRAAYTYVVGPIPDGLELDHLCRNKACVNPDHLEAVTAWENHRRMILAMTPSTHCKYGHALTSENVIRRKDKANTHLGFRCRTCARQNRRESKARVRARRRGAPLPSVRQSERKPPAWGEAPWIERREG